MILAFSGRSAQGAVVVLCLSSEEMDELAILLS